MSGVWSVECLCSPSGVGCDRTQGRVLTPRGWAVEGRGTWDTPFHSQGRGVGSEDDFCVVLDTLYAKITEKENGTRFSYSCRCCGLSWTVVYTEELAPLSHIPTE